MSLPRLTSAAAVGPHRRPANNHTWGNGQYRFTSDAKIGNATLSYILGGNTEPSTPPKADSQLPTPPESGSRTPKSCLTCQRRQSAEQEIPVKPASPATNSTATRSGRSWLLQAWLSNHLDSQLEFRDCFGYLTEFSFDQHGSRIIQKGLEKASANLVMIAFHEIEPRAVPLMVDAFGNYVIQKLIERGERVIRDVLAHKMRGQVPDLSANLFGCRVVQEMLKSGSPQNRSMLVGELIGYESQLARHQNGNHVLQMALSSCGPAHVCSIISGLRGHTAALSIHPYGCRVIQRCLEHGDDQCKAMIVGEVAPRISSMAFDQYGNYVVQHIVMHTSFMGRGVVLYAIGQNAVRYSKHKFASNVVEKCIRKGTDKWRQDLIAAFTPFLPDGSGFDYTVLIKMINCDFANYVLQTLLQKLCDEDFYPFVQILKCAMEQAKQENRTAKYMSQVERWMHRTTSGPPKSPAVKPTRPAPHSHTECQQTAGCW